MHLAGTIKATRFSDRVKLVSTHIMFDGKFHLFNVRSKFECFCFTLSMKTRTDFLFVDRKTNKTHGKFARVITLKDQGRW